MSKTQTLLLLTLALATFAQTAVDTNQNWNVAPKCKNFDTPLLILEAKMPMESSWAMKNSLDKGMFQYCTNTRWSCCTPGDVRKIGDNFNRDSATYTSKASLLKSFDKWWGVVDDIFAQKKKLIEIADKVIGDAKAYKGVKKSAQKMKDILANNTVELTTRYNANQCYTHTGSVAVGSVCSVCDADAMKRYDSFSKKMYLNNFDVRNFKNSCLRYIGESLPVLADLLKYVYQIASLESDMSKPKDKLKFMQAEFFDNLEIGKIESHQKCDPMSLDQNSTDACNGLVNAYYTQGVLLKPEYQLLPQMEIIRNWILELNAKQPKRMLKNRVLAQAQNIEPAEGLEQLWSKFWTVEFRTSVDPKAPQMALTALELKSGLSDLKMAKNPKLATPSGFRPAPATWETPKDKKAQDKKKATKNLAQRPGKN